MSYFRPAVDALRAYEPGEQPAPDSGATVIKLNTNENPYPPSPRAMAVLRDIDPEQLRRYPDAYAAEFRDTAADVLGIEPRSIVVGNGSDDILTMLIRLVADATRPVALVGVVKRMQFSNPHSWIYIDVPTDSGEIQEWAIEGAAPNALLRRGWSRESLPAGTEISVRGFQARDRTRRAAGRDIRLPDGSELFIGSTGVGAAPELPD